jgi:hypothetical protein
MARSAKSVGVVALTAAITTVLASLVIPGCTQNQDNSPISISNSQGRLILSVACSTDGSVAYVTDGRNVYRYASSSAGQLQSWQCILSQAERLEIAVRHDPNERQQTPSR